MSEDNKVIGVIQRQGVTVAFVTGLCEFDSVETEDGYRIGVMESLLRFHPLLAGNPNLSWEKIGAKPFPHWSLEIKLY